MFSLMYNNVAAVSTIPPSYFDVYDRTEPPGPEHVPTSYLGRPSGGELLLASQEG
ncbi:hypothetical protein L209DRAFT_749133 [Thermothelomyces heterothallicus CBS 203.75]